MFFYARACTGKHPGTGGPTPPPPNRHGRQHPSVTSAIRQERIAGKTLLPFHLVSRDDGADARDEVEKPRANPYRRHDRSYSPLSSSWLPALAKPRLTMYAAAMTVPSRQARNRFNEASCDAL